VTPDDSIVQHFLANSMVARVATLSAKGVPALTPLWFVLERGRLVATTGAATLAARNAATHPEVAVLLDAEAAGRSPHVLRLLGRASVHAGLPPWRVLVRVAAKYYAGRAALRSELANAGRWRLRARYYAQSEAAWLAIEPVRAELLRRPEPL
jgi:hypothetical protein